MLQALLQQSAANNGNPAVHLFYRELIGLVPGDNNVGVVVESQGRTVSNMALTVFVDSDLNVLRLRGLDRPDAEGRTDAQRIIALDRFAFDTNRVEYEVRVPFRVSRVAFTPTYRTFDSLSISVDGSSVAPPVSQTPSQWFNLAVGQTLTLRIASAPDVTAYTLRVTRMQPTLSSVDRKSVV